MSDARAHCFFIQPPITPATLSELIDSNNLKRVQQLVLNMSLLSIFQVLSHYIINNDSQYFEIVYEYLSKKKKTLLITQYDLLLMAVANYVKDIVVVILKPYARYYQSQYLISPSNNRSSLYLNAAVINLMTEINDYDKQPNQKQQPIAEALLEYLFSLLVPAHQYEFFSKIQSRQFFGKKIKFINGIMAVVLDSQKIEIIENFVFNTDCCLHIPTINWVTLFKQLPLGKQRSMLTKNPNGGLLLASLPITYSLDDLNDLLKCLTPTEKIQATVRLQVDLRLKKVITTDSLKELQHLLSQHSVDLNALIDGDRPVTLAVKSNALSILKYLSRLSSVDLNGKNIDEATPLVLAVILNKPHMVEYLALDPKVNLYIVDSKGMTAFDYALIYKHYTSVICLQNIAKTKLATTADIKCIRKVAYVTQLAHKLGLASLRQKVKEGSQEIDVQHGEGNFLIKSLPALQASFEEIWEEKATNLELQTMRDSILLALSLNARFYKSQATPLQLLSHYIDNKILLLSSGWYRHGMAIILYKNYLVICNRGHGRDKQGITIYRIHRGLVTLGYIERCTYVECRDNVIPYAESHIMTDKTNKTFVAMLKHIKSIIYPDPGACPVAVLEPRSQAYGTCTFVNPKSAVYAMFYLLFKEKNDSFYLEDYSHIVSYQAAYSQYKSATGSLRENAVKGLIKHVNKAVSVYDKQFYMSLSLQVAEELLQKSFKSEVRMQRVTTLLTALNNRIDDLRDEPSLYRTYQELLMRAALRYNVIADFNRLLLTAFSDDCKLLLSSTFMFEAYHIFSTVVALAIHPMEGRSADYKLLAKKMVAAGMTLQVEHDLAAMINSGAFDKLNSVLELLLIGKPPSDLIAAIKNDNWQQVSSIVTANTEPVDGVPHPHYKYYEYAGRYENYFVHLAGLAMFDSLPPLKCVRLLLSYANQPDKLNSVFYRTDYFFKVLESDISAAKNQPTLIEAVVMEWYAINYFTNMIKESEFIPNRLLSLNPKLVPTKDILNLITLDNDQAGVWADAEWDKVLSYIAQGVSPNVSLKNAGFLLVKAAAENRLQVVRTLIEKSARLVRRCDVLAVLNHAIQHKNDDMLECLLNAHEVDGNELSIAQERAVNKYCEQPFKPALGYSCPA